MFVIACVTPQRGAQDLMDGNNAPTEKLSRS
jgi:hypothetical protein